MSDPKDVEALLGEHRFSPVAKDGFASCSCGVAWFGGISADHRAHVAAVLTEYVVKAQREAVLGAAADPSLRLAGHGGISIRRLRAHAATTYPTPKETL